MAGDDAVLCVVGVGTGCVCHLPSRDARRRLATFSGSTINKIKILMLFIYFIVLYFSSNNLVGWKKRFIVQLLNISYIIEN